MRREYWLLICGCFFVLITGLIIYFNQFHGDFSHDQNIFGAFGSYLNPFLTIISIVLLCYISFQANHINETYHRIQWQPLLFFDFNSCKLIKEQQSWVLVNGFGAPAINILIRFNLREDGPFTEWVNCFSMHHDQRKSIGWMRYPHRIEVLWTDITGKNYFGLQFTEWTGKLLTGVEKRRYTEALEKARRRPLNISDLIWRDFEQDFGGLQKQSFTLENYTAFLHRKCLL